ncbi:type II toxin-antitoxin system VapC family toxin [Phreatobacter aquaticus]|uniref:Ribonuclease VapC n=1 Tax=Phreatobacter aquaticus TaxID=2570229 RepID=A0A4D7QAT9_9HYPH|nr:type II toxin-antitoxin system VapC family toxin [Phreatobacter aquaticus]QCK84318.1 type II toxin-antitoxin system VapC family toxin [Phreatobacter aquaticus]
MTVVDTNVLIDIFSDDPTWARWSTEQVIAAGNAGPVVTTPINYAELSARFDKRSDLTAWLDRLEVKLEETPPDALFRAGKAFAAYRESGGPRTSLLADFLIGAHAEVIGHAILTRDTRRFRTYFPAVRLIAPDTP